MPKKIVIFSTIPRDHDVSDELDRRSKWKPLVELIRIQDFPVARLYCFINPSHIKHIELLYNDLKQAASGTEIIFVPVTMESDFSSERIKEAYTFFSDYFDNFIFDTAREDYYFHFSPGNKFSHAFMLTMLINIRNIPCKIVHLRSNDPEHSGKYHAELYECKINRWVSEIGKLERDNSDSLELLKSSIKTRNPAFNTLIENIEHVARHSAAPILFSGPTGSGKSQLAKRIYELRVRRGMVSGPFVSINCATVRGDNAMSTLFGHVKGSFTGAQASRKGLLRTAHEGILFLDEVGELSLDMQDMMLKAIEEKCFIPFGADEEVSSSFQLICASNRDLREEMRRGRFRLDLLARINLWHFRLPALRERPEDIEPNIDFELRRLTAEKGLFADFLPSARKKYLDFAVSKDAVWPGNFRSLAGSVERMLTYSFQGVIDDAVVERETAMLRRAWREDEEKGSPAFPLLARLKDEHGIELADSMDLFDKIQLEQVLEICRDSGTRSLAGRRLFAISRAKKKSNDDTARLNKYLKSYGLDWDLVQALR
ncbi:RNA repair transcriptional activator RtcR family protein [Desulfovibrio sp. OttesenSCG-928-C06]|nr:RNA repair transcriptional activator RtcR family protein [Desulfovibrio sp. OttesenSCG-928-C06]